MTAAGDLEGLRAASADQVLIDRLRASDPETLIAFQLALAQAYAEAGLRDEAVAAYARDTGQSEALRSRNGMMGLYDGLIY